MSPEPSDRELYDLIYESLIPCGYRPRTDDEIEAMLDACGGDELDADQFARMMRVVRGEQQIGLRERADDSFDESQLTETQRELIALHRAQGEALPPEIQSLLSKLRNEARNRRDQDNGNGKGI